MPPVYAEKLVVKKLVSVNEGKRLKDAKKCDLF